VPYFALFRSLYSPEFLLFNALLRCCSSLAAAAATACRTCGYFCAAPAPAIPLNAACYSQRIFCGDQPSAILICAVHRACLA